MGCMATSAAAMAAVVVESELDAILIDQEARDLCSAIALGNSSRKPDAKTFEILKQSVVILLALDFDRAGIKSMQWWKDTFIKSKYWPVPAGGDPGEAFKKKVNIRKWIQAGLPESWNLGPYRLGSKFEKKPDFENKSRQDAAPPCAAAVPSGVVELRRLLKGTPGVIYKNPKRTAIHESHAWAAKNWELSQKISRRVYFDPEVFGYIEAHPENSITYKNIILKQ